MANKQNIAEKYGVDLKDFRARDVIVKNHSIPYLLGGVLEFAFACIFLLMAIKYKDNKFVFAFGILLSVVLLLCSIIIFLDMFSLKIEWKGTNIYYRHFWKKININVTDIRYFVAEEDNRDSMERVHIYLNDRKIEYMLSTTNKENLIFLLNLLKNGIEQRYDIY